MVLDIDAVTNTLVHYTNSMTNLAISIIFKSSTEIHNSMTNLAISFWRVQPKCAVE